MARLKTLLFGAALTVLASPVAELPGHVWATYPIAEAPAELRPLIQRADMTIISLQTAVLRELAQKLPRDGPAVALKSCHLWSVAAAFRLEREEGIAAGRTSDRLRNPKNAPRPWAAPIVERYAGRRSSDVDGFVVDLGGRVGVMRPIYAGATCGACHGPLKTLDPGVRAQLDELYPADRAVGYRQGDLRGWFWVEVSKKGP